MNKFFTFSSLLLSGVLLGSLAGRITTNEVLKAKRSNITKSSNNNNVKNYLKRPEAEEEDINHYFI